MPTARDHLPPAAVTDPDGLTQVAQEHGLAEHAAHFRDLGDVVLSLEREVLDMLAATRG